MKVIGLFNKGDSNSFFEERYFHSPNRMRKEATGSFQSENQRKLRLPASKGDFGIVLQIPKQQIQRMTSQRQADNTPWSGTYVANLSTGPAHYLHTSFVKIECNSLIR
jgi:hypothetical protein